MDLRLSLRGLRFKSCPEHNCSGYSNDGEKAHFG